MAREGKRLEFPDADPLREYSEAEKRRLTENLLALQIDIDEGTGTFAHRDLTPALVAEFHRSIFEGVRGFAGRMRRPQDGERRVVFGPHRGMDRDEVADAMEEVCRKAQRSF